jgi:hypothetical protein
MKKLLLLLFFTAPMFGFAQTAIPALQPKGPYCLAVIYRGFSKYEASIDDGTGKKSKDMMIKDEKGKPMKFNAVINFVNYLAQNGWSIISSYEDTSGGGVPNVAFVIKRS